MTNSEGRGGAMEQCFLGKTKPTCQNLAIFDLFQKRAKNQGDVLARGLSIDHLVITALPAP